jgi:hypothetical protein
MTDLSIASDGDEEKDGAIESLEKKLALMPFCRLGHEKLNLENLNPIQNKVFEMNDDEWHEIEDTVDE